ncbi:unnamed protein product [Prorocentrum cordatum]|uniref:ADP-ribosylation factor-like protein 6-interacting protein 4 n=1 Tax=Prorocentrum cordatum TaxID=2364126 RepID=A0ABN9UU71_9DINO|nr:unnamed protein product [Polarella glacialis]
MGKDDSSDSSSEEKAKKKTKKKEKKKEKRKDKKGGKKDKKDEKKRKKADKKGGKKVGSSSDSSDSDHNEKKAKRKDGDGKDQARETWIFNREKAIRKAEPDLPKGDALRRAVEEYCSIYDIGVGAEEAKAAKAAEAHAIPEVQVNNEAIQDALEAAVAESAEKVRKEAELAMASVLQVAEQQGLLFTAKGADKVMGRWVFCSAKERQEQMSMFLTEKERQLEECALARRRSAREASAARYVRLGAPLTDDRPRGESAANPSNGKVDVTKLRLFNAGRADL